MKLRHLPALMAAMASWPTAACAADLAWRLEITGGVSNRLVWQTETGRRYDLHGTENLPAWSHVDGFPKTGTGDPMEHAFAAATRGFFVIEAMPVVPGEFTAVPAGFFAMGDTFGEGRADERPVFDLHLPEFRMGRNLVTKGLWDEVRQWGATNGYTDLPAGFGRAADHPVGSVSWYAAVKWCNARSERDGLPACYTVNGAVYRTGSVKRPVCLLTNAGYRLPTEAEWEKAARGGLAGRRFPWGDTIRHEQANYLSTNALAYDISPTRGYHPAYTNGPIPYTSPAGSFPTNGFGLHDLAGNVFEWCGDWYDLYPSNQGGPVSGDYRIYRGGGWGTTAWYARCAYREPLSPSLASVSLGFRLVWGQP